MTLIQAPTQGQAIVTQVALSDLISLKDTDFKLPEHATRPIDLPHVVNLSETDSTKWPPIKVVETDEGLAVIDGYHRWNALQRQIIISALGLEDATIAAQNKALQAPLDEKLQEAIDRTLNDTTILAEIGVYHTEKDVIKAALTANLQHGMPPSSKALVYIALDLYDITRGETPEPSQAEIARLVGISRATLNEYLKKREKQASVESVTEGTEGATSEEDTTEKEIQSEIGKAVKKATTLIASLEKIYDEYPQAFTEAIKVLFPFVVNGIADMNGTVTDKTYADNLTQILSTEELTTAYIPHITRLGKNIVAATKTLEKTHGITAEKPATTTQATKK